MRQFLQITLLIMLVIQLNAQEHPKELSKIERIENGLLEFISPGGMLYPDSAQLANRKTLTERMDFYKVPGLSISLVNDGKVEWTKAYGITDVNTKAPVTENTIFEAASTSKFVSAVLALHFVEKGLVDPDRNINDYLKRWQIPENQFTQKEKVTLRRVLTHQAGLPTTNFSYDDSLGYPSLINVLKGELPAMNKPAIPELVPGEQWQYSNVGYDLVQLLLEDLTGEPFPVLAEEIIFKPLGMKSTFFSYPLSEESKQYEAMPHDGDKISHEPSMHLTAFAHAGVTSTTNDLAKFTNEIMNTYNGKSDKIISQKTAKELFTAQCDIDPRIFGIPIAEGLGVLLMGEGDDFTFAHPGHNLPGMTSWLIGWLTRGVGVVIMTNGTKGDLLSMEIISAIVQEYLR